MFTGMLVALFAGAMFPSSNDSEHVEYKLFKWLFNDTPTPSPKTDHKTIRQPNGATTEKVVHAHKAEVVEVERTQLHTGIDLSEHAAGVILLGVSTVVAPALAVSVIGIPVAAYLVYRLHKHVRTVFYKHVYVWSAAPPDS